MRANNILNSVVALCLLQLFACTGMQSTDSLEAIRAVKSLRQDQSLVEPKVDDGDVEDLHAHDHEDKANKHSEDQHQGDDHGDDHDHSQDLKNLSIVEMETWYDTVSEQLVDQLENKDLRQLIIWQTQQKVWARAVLKDANPMLFFSCQAHQGHIDCQAVEKDKVPDIPVFANKEDE
ncbi:hypothetical protein MRY82_03200 [bacterium]|nr:hypothetical protein [bacterium]